MFRFTMTSCVDENAAEARAEARLMRMKLAATLVARTQPKTGGERLRARNTTGQLPTTTTRIRDDRSSLVVPRSLDAAYIHRAGEGVARNIENQTHPTERRYAIVVHER